MSTEPAKPDVKSCGVLIFREEPTLSFLLMEHRDRLDLPKGHVDPGESDLETALRELEEETGITSDDIKLDPDFRYSHCYQVHKKRYGNVPKLKELVIFMATLTNDVELELTEHIGYQWVEWDPPHQIQEKTIDPLLAEVSEFLANRS